MIKQLLNFSKSYWKNKWLYVIGKKIGENGKIGKHNFLIL
jgi:hypothetical protein